jgi:hypothetical protein
MKMVVFLLIKSSRELWRAINQEVEEEERQFHL